MDFWQLPPEINSTRIWTGPGATPLFDAALAWDATATNLTHAATGCWAVISTTSWTGPSADSMRAATATYITWLTATAAQAESTAAQARVAAAAYETALNAIVPPEVVAANRAQLTALIAANWLGQNTPAIAATEAAYAEMWTQDITAMADYQTDSTSITSALQPFTPAVPLINPGTLDATKVPVIGLDSGSLLGQYLQSFISSGPYLLPTAVVQLFATMWAIDSAQAVTAFMGSSVVLPSPSTTGQSALPNVPPSVTVRASMGNAQRLNALSVPPSWAHPASPSAPQASPPPPRPVPRDEIDVPIPAPLPVGARGTPTRQDRPQPEYGVHVRFVPRPPAGG